MDALGKLRRALFVLTMNEHKSRVGDRAKAKHRANLRAACLEYLGKGPDSIRSLAVEIGDWVDTPDFQSDSNANAPTIDGIEEIINSWVNA